MNGAQRDDSPFPLHPVVLRSSWIVSTPEYSGRIQTDLANLCLSICHSHAHFQHFPPLSPAMTSSKAVRVRIPSPPASSTSTTSSSDASRHTTTTYKSRDSHCSKCSHCKTTTTESKVNRKSCLKPSGPTQTHQHVASYQPHPPPMDHRMHGFQQPTFHGPSYVPPAVASQPISMPMGMGMGMGTGVSMPMPVHMPHEPRLNPSAPAPVLHHLGRGPEPLFGWDSVMPLNHTYGQPRYIRRIKPDYRRFCFSVGKADVPFTAMPGGPLWGMDVTMAPQMVGSHRW